MTHACDFFDRPADRVARELLGAWLVVRGSDGRLRRHAVFETEAYLGAHDLACHGSKGMTKRNAVMFGPAGRWYVYLFYGMHWMLNVVTGAEGVPAAVLIWPPLPLSRMQRLAERVKLAIVTKAPLLRIKCPAVAAPGAAPRAESAAIRTNPVPPPLTTVAPA